MAPGNEITNKCFLDTLKMVNIFILYVSTLHLRHSSEDDLNDLNEDDVKSKRKE